MTLRLAALAVPAAVLAGLCAPAAADPVDLQGRTPLMLAIAAGDLALARKRVAEGADLEAVDKAGRSVAFHALRRGWTELLPRKLLDAPRDKPTVTGETLVHAALLGGDAKQAAALLKSSPAPGAARARTRDGRTLMHYARGTQAILLLLDAGLDANARDTAGRTPLHGLAIELAERGAKAPADAAPRELETIQALVAVGANADARDDNGQAARDFWPPLTQVAGRR